MGFRSTIISQDIGVGQLPKWFKDKYEGILSFPNGLMIASKIEAKFYSGEMFMDYQTALNEVDYFKGFSEDYKTYILVLSEGGNITKVVITKEDVKFIIITDFGDYESNSPYY